MPRYSEKRRMRLPGGVSLPVLAAAFLFLAALMSVAVWRSSSEAQAERVLQGMYTVNRYQPFSENAAAEVTEGFCEKFRGNMTEDGKEELLKLGLSYRLLRRERIVDRVYAGEVRLRAEKPVFTAFSESSQSPQGTKEAGNKAGNAEDAGDAGNVSKAAKADKRVREAVYTYEIPVETSYVKFGDAVQPVLREVYTGTVRLKKTGFLNWRLDGVTSALKR